MNFALSLSLIITLFAMVILGIVLFRQSMEEKRENKKLENQNKVLETKDAKKDEFLSFATHQLRSPLTSIKWGLENLKEKYNDEMFGQLLLTTEDLVSTVNDLLDISKIEQNNLALNFEEFDLHDFLGRIIEEFRNAAIKKNIKLVFDSENIPLFVNADATKLRQVFVNLIDNAIKYTKEGSVTVTLRKENEKALVSVSDTGLGMSDEDLKCLFEKFVKGSAGKAALGGSGLGLYLSKKIVEAHKGEISASSDGAEKGSLFKVLLPLKS